MRTIIDLPESDRETLDTLSRKLGISRAEAVRRAVAEFLKSHRSASDDELFGIWRNRNEDALVYEDRVRAEWNRR
jgi:metal-responsive CopG/Arc/MetJ family transcriptional regulator